MCLVAFQKIFRKIFFGVWKRRRKTQIQKNTSHNLEKNHQRRQIHSDDRAVDRNPRSQSTARSHEASIAISDLPLSPTYEISRSTFREIAPSIAISRRRRDRDRRGGRRTGFVVIDDFFLGCGLCFSGFVFSFFFSKHQKIFSGKFFEMQQNTWKHFPFPEISISGKYVFSKNRFTATKHSLNSSYHHPVLSYLVQCFKS